MRDAIVLLSGGMDSCVALYWAFHKSGASFSSCGFRNVHAINFVYGQRAAMAEVAAAHTIWKTSRALGIPGNYKSLALSGFSSANSLLGGFEVNKYENVEGAVEGTSTDKSYMPLRNAVLVTMAAHHLLVLSPDGGEVIIGTRARAEDPDSGFPDCTPDFANSMTSSLTKAAGKPVSVFDPLNYYATSRSETIQLARDLPGCWEALAHTNSCFEGKSPPCGHCLPCLRRAQAFEYVGMADPAVDHLLTKGPYLK